MRGISNVCKCRKLYRYLQEAGSDISFVQETHSTAHTAKLWVREFGHKMVFSHGTSNSRGVAIFFHSPKITVREIIRDTYGRYVICRIKINEDTYGLVNVYAPTEGDSDVFVKKLASDMTSCNCDFWVMGGDFNVTQNIDMDQLNNRDSKPKTRQVLKSVMETFDLIDVWRENHLEERKYTWFRRKPKPSASRLDYFLTSECLVNKTVSCDISTCTLSDHSSVNLVIETDLVKRGPGLWRLNNNILKNELFTTGLKMELLQTELLEDRTSNENLIRNYQSVRAEIDSGLERDAKKAAFIAKCRYVKDGERSSKYFFGMGKRDFVNKTMYKIRRADGTLTKDYSEILQIQSDFYDSLYTSNPTVNFDITNNSGIFLSQEDKDRLDTPITKEEMWNALKTMKNDKCPGLDGLTKEFYVTFFDTLSEPLFRLYYHCLNTGSLNPTARKGVIQLIPKRGRDETRIGSWRPLMILDYDYKVLARVLAIRMDSVMNQIIGPKQTGFVRGRNIAHNILCTKEIIAYSKKNNRKCVIVNIDFEKCFDSVEYCAIWGSMRYFNFGEHFISWAKLLFSNFNFCTKNNGFFSEFTPKTRGVNQGCPASPGIYNLSGEVMAHLLKANTNIKGISVNNVTKLLSQFADDTSIFTSYDQLSIENICNTLQRVEECIGLKISYEKTDVYRIGSLYKSEAKLYTSQNLKWTNDKMHTLGIYIACDGTPVKENYTEIVDKIESVCSNWYNKTSTLMGKILILNSLIGSLFVYKISVMVELTSQEISEVEKIIHNFLWNGKKARIAMETLKKEKFQGGLRLFDLKCKQDCIRIKWIFTIAEDEFLENCMYCNLDATLRELIWQVNINQVHVGQIFEDSQWRGLLSSWATLNFYTPTTPEEVANQILWYNSHLLICNKPFIFRKWVELGILYVKDLYANGVIMSFKEMCELWGQISWLEYVQIVSIIPADWKEKMCIPPNEIETYISLYETLRTSPPAGLSRKVYSMLIYNEFHMLKYAKRWEETGLEFEWDEWIKSFQILYKCTKITKYRDFQYRMLLGKIVTNKELYGWGKIPSPLCTFCQLDIGSIEHTFIRCKYVYVIILWFKEICVKNNITLDIDKPSNILFNIINISASNIIHFILIAIKQYVYRCQCLNKKPALAELKKEILYLEKLTWFNSYGEQEKK